MDVTGYLGRIGATADDPLAVLVGRQLHAVPFETLSVHLDEPISLDPAALYDKIVVRRRGGFCHELNGLFAGLLRELGYEVTLLGGRVAAADGFGPPLDHVALSVTADEGGPWLVDVGFGRFGVGPVTFDDAAAVREVEDGDLDVLAPDGSVGYRLERHPRTTADFVPLAWWQTTSPDAPFAVGPVCSLPTAGGGRVTLAGHLLVVTDAAGTRTEEELTDGEALAAYRDRFGIALDRLPSEPDRT